MKVTAAIFRDGDKFLLMRRAADQPLAGEWEYPGGKFEDGEDGPTCLCRELYEELGIDAPDHYAKMVWDCVCGLRCQNYIK